MELENKNIVSSEFILELIDKLNPKYKNSSIIFVIVGLFFLVELGIRFIQILPLIITLFVAIVIYFIIDHIKRERHFVSHIITQNISANTLQQSFKLRGFGEKKSLGDKIIASVSKKHTENLRILYNQLSERKVVLLSAPLKIETPIIIPINSKKYNNKIVLDAIKISLNANEYFFWQDISDIYISVNNDGEGIDYYYLHILLNTSQMSKKDSFTFLINDTEQNIILYELWMRAQLPKYKITTT
jgi:hypothetical protein